MVLYEHVWPRPCSSAKIQFASLLLCFANAPSRVVGDAGGGRLPRTARGPIESPWTGKKADWWPFKNDFKHKESEGQLFWPPSLSFEKSDDLQLSQRGVHSPRAVCSWCVRILTK